MRYVMSLVAMVGMLSGASVFANSQVNGQQGNGQKIEKRIEHQNARIERKLKKKKISEEKAAELKKEVQAVEQKKETMLKEGNGKLTKEQRKELHGELKKTGEEIKSSAPAAQ